MAVWMVFVRSADQNLIIFSIRVPENYWVQTRIRVDGKLSRKRLEAIVVAQCRRQDRIRSLPHRGTRVVMPSPEVIEPRLLIELLPRKEERRPLRITVLRDPGLPEREVFEVFVELAVSVGDVVGASQVIGVIEEEIFLEGGVAVRIGSDGVLLHEFRDDSRGAGVDVLGAGGARSLGEELINVYCFALRSALDGSGALVVVLIGLGLAVVGDGLGSILFVPGDGSTVAVGVLGPA